MLFNSVCSILNPNFQEIDRGKGKEAEPVILTLKDKAIHSLKELRENYSPEELLKYHMNGDLVIWLNQHYYEREADKISSVKINDANCLEQICSALSIPFNAKISPEELEALFKKKELLRQYTNDESILANPHSVAMNQEELALLLNEKCKKIYLCAEEFSIPISIANVEYIGIANATITHPYTEQQYLRAGIKLQGFDLPKDEDPENATSAMNAARSNGYDDYSENHSDLASAFHDLFKRRKFTKVYRIPYNSSISVKRFTSEYECEKSAKAEITKAYDKAVNYLTTGNSSCIAKESAKIYAEHFNEEIEQYMDLLKKIALMTSSGDLFQKVEDQVSKSYKYLLSKFEAELNDSADYYRMYDFNYFLDRIDIEEHDNRISDNDAFRLVERLFTGSIEYSVNDLHTTISEIEKDLNDYCSTFFNAAYSEYQAFTSKIEKMIDIIGKKLPSRADGESLIDYMTRCCIKLAL